MKNNGNGVVSRVCVAEVQSPDTVPDTEYEHESTVDQDPVDHEGTDRADTGQAKDENGPRPRRLSVSVSARGLACAVVIVALAAGLATVGWFYVEARRTLDSQARSSADYSHAEQLALDYAVNAAAMNFEDIDGWKAKLVAGTSPELNEKLNDAADSMQQILVPLQWTSTAEPLIAKVRSDQGGIYVVDCFVSVQTKTVQAPDPLQSTATYSLTLDSNKDWQITDVGGVGAVVGQK